MNGHGQVFTVESPVNQQQGINEGRIKQGGHGIDDFHEERGLVNHDVFEKVDVQIPGENTHQETEIEKEEKPPHGFQEWVPIRFMNLKCIKQNARAHDYRKRLNPNRHMLQRLFRSCCDESFAVVFQNNAAPCDMHAFFQPVQSLRISSQFTEWDGLPITQHLLVYVYYAKYFHKGE